LKAQPAAITTWPNQQSQISNHQRIDNQPSFNQKGLFRSKRDNRVTTAGPARREIAGGQRDERNRSHHCKVRNRSLTSGPPIDNQESAITNESTINNRQSQMF